MAKIVCSKCGATGWSKCPYCRTVFPDNKTEALLSHVLKWKFTPGDNVKVEYSYFTTDEELDEKEVVVQALKSLLNTLSAMESGAPWTSIEQYACNHKWVFAPGEKSSIECGH